MGDKTTADARLQDPSLLVIPASPNWYCSTASSCNNYGLVAFAARNQIFIYDISSSHISFKDSLQFSKERLTSICWLPFKNDSSNLLAAGGEDGIVRVVDLEGRKIVTESKKHNSKICAMVSAEGDTILTGDEKGLLVLWSYKASETSTWLPVPAAVFSIATEPRSGTLVAIGYANGHVLICDIKRQSVMQHYKSHLDEVQSLAWQPSSSSLSCDSTDEYVDGLLVASGSKDKTIRVWDVKKETPLLTLNVPTKTSGHKGRRKVDEMNRAKLWVAMCWHKMDSLITSSSSGDILIWNLKTKSSTCIAPAHNRIIFNISHDSAAKKFVTTSMDRQIMFWDADTCELLTSMPSLGGYVYSLDASYLDPYKVIFGVGDNLVRVWNTRLDDKPYETSLIWQGIKSKVTVVVCHSAKESVIGFGTDDGHVGIYNISSGKYDVSVSYHKKTVYSLSWGPLCGDEVDNNAASGNCLYSCGGEGTILIHSMNHLQNKARDMNSIIKKTNSIQEKLPPRSDVEWKRDLKYVAIGNEDGSIEIFSSPKLEKVCTILVHRKIINCMKWHPHIDDTYGDNSYSNWIASGSSDNYVCVSDLTSVLEKTWTDHQPKVIKEKFRYFNLHSQRITCLSWSPHSVAFLASSSYDGTVQIWNVVKNELIANFRSHNGRVLCVFWSFVDPDVVYSGSEDFTLRKWAISDCRHKSPPEAKKSASQSNGSEGKKKSKPVRAKSENESREVGENGVHNEVIDEIKNQLLNVKISGEHSNGQMTSDDIKKPTADENLRAMKSMSKNESVLKRTPNKAESKKKKAKSMFPLSSTQNHKSKSASQLECVLLAKYLQTSDNPDELADFDGFEPGTNDYVNLGLFSDPISTYKMFSSEGQNHAVSGSVDQQLHLDLWQGNFGGALKTCRETGELNEMMVAMSPLGGYDVWQSTMKAYADQLASKGDYIAAATYYVAVNKVHDAIDMFKMQNMFKEAISLAKVRLTSSDPTLIELYQLWGERQSAESCYENAAKCYMASGDYKTAINLLARKGDVKSLKTAAEVALIYKEDDTANAILKQCAEILLTDFNWKEVKEVTDLMHQPEGVVLQSVIHELLSRCFVGIEVDDSLNLSSYVEKTGVFISNDDLGKQSGLKGQSNISLPPKAFLEIVADVFLRQTGKLIPSQILKSDDLISKSGSFMDDVNLKNVLLSVSFDLAMGAIKLMESDTRCFCAHWLSAMNTLCKACQFEAMGMLYKLLFPRDFASFQALLESCSSPQLHQNETRALFQNAHAFYQTSVLHQFWWKQFPKLNKEEILKRTDVSGDCDKSKIDFNDEALTLVLPEKIDSANFLPFISRLKVDLLSKMHCRLSQLRLCVKNNEKSFLELRIKKQLREHIISKNEENRTKKAAKSKKNAREVLEKAIGGKPSADDDENWREREAVEMKRSNDLEKESREEEVISREGSRGLKLGNEAELTVEAFEVVDDERLQMMERENEEMKGEIEVLERKVAIESFPDCMENAKILLYIIFYFAMKRFRNDGSSAKGLLHLADDIIVWGLECSVLSDDQRHFEKFQERIKTFGRRGISGTEE